MKPLIARFKEYKHVIRDTILYGGSVWGMLQVFDFLSDTFGWPESVIKSLIIIGFGSLPSAFIFFFNRGRNRTLKIQIISYSINVILIVTLILFTQQAGNPSNLTPDTTIASKSLAVLPFKDMSEQKDQEYFSDGLTEELLTLLASIHELKVIGRSSSFTFKGKDEDVRVIGQKLGVANILEGSVRKSGNKLRISVQLINTSDGSLQWSQNYDSQLDDIFRIQNEIARSVIKELKVTLLGLKTYSTLQNTEAYNLYLQGKYFANLVGEENYQKASYYYKQALALDPNYAPAWAGLAVVYSNQAILGYLSNKEGFKMAQQAAARAIKNDSLLPDGYRAMSLIYSTHLWDWKKADQSLKKALELDPKNAAALSRAGELASSLDRTSEAINFYNESISLDPLRPVTYLNLGIALYYESSFEESEQKIKKALEINPDMPEANYLLAKLYLSQNKPDVALEFIRREPDEGWRAAGLPLIYHKLGNKKQVHSSLKELIEKFSDDLTYQIAEVYAYHGEIDLAFQWLDRAYRNRDPGLSELKGDPLLRILSNDPRWVVLLEKMNLPG